MVPLAKRQAVCFGIMSYDGQVNFGLIGDYDAMPDLDALAADLEASLAELAEAVPSEEKKKTRRSRTRSARQRSRRRRPRGPGAAGAWRRPRAAARDPAHGRGHSSTVHRPSPDTPSTLTMYMLL